MAKKRFFAGSYTGVDARRSQEARDSGMISESSTGIAHMPQEVIYREYPAQTYNMPEGLNDSMSGIDRQVKDDMKGKKPINSEKF